MLKRIFIYTFFIPALLLSGCFEEQEFSVAGEISYLAISESSAIFNEGAEENTFMFDVIYSGTSNGSGISYELSTDNLETNAEEGVDYTISPAIGAGSIPAGASSVTYTVEILDNDQSVGLRDLLININSAGDIDLGYLGAEEGTSLSISIVEDDATLFAFSSFEDVDVTGRSLQYSKSGFAGIDNILGEAPVDFIATGDELGFDSFFNEDDIGDDGTEYIGVGTFTNLNLSDPADVPDMPFSYLDGVQGFHGNDIDGLLEIQFDEITFPEDISTVSISLGVFIGGFDSDAEDRIELLWRTADGDRSLFTIQDAGEVDGVATYADEDGNSFETVSWQVVRRSFDASEELLTGHVVIRMRCDNDADAFFVDDLNISYIK